VPDDRHDFFSVASGFYRTCVLDGVLEHSPAEHVRRPRSGMTGPAAAWTGTPPTSSPPTSPAPPD